MKNESLPMLLFRSQSRLNRTERKDHFMETKTRRITNSTNGWLLRCGLFVIPLVLAALAFSVTAQAQLVPPPDGGYTNNNTAEGSDALFSLTNGPDNTALGFHALYSNTTGDSN